jgi:hypothetical protein
MIEPIVTVTIVGMSAVVSGLAFALNYFGNRPAVAGKRTAETIPSFETGKAIARSVIREEVVEGKLKAIRQEINELKIEQASAPVFKVRVMPRTTVFVRYALKANKRVQRDVTETQAHPTLPRVI